jgi:hypothetical protein
MKLNSIVREELVQYILSKDVFGALCIDYMDLMTDAEIVSYYMKAE